jgi:HEAT repeat protein
LQSLSNYSQNERYNILIFALQDVHPQVRLHAALVLARLGYAHGRELLLQIEPTHTDSALAEQIRAALTALDTHVEDLIAQLARPSMTDHVTLLRRLNNTRHPRALLPLLAATHDVDNNVRAEAFRLLPQWHNPRIVPHVLACLARRTANSNLIITCLGNLGDIRAIETLLG